MQIACDQQGEVYTVFINGRLDSAGAGELEIQIKDIIAGVKEKLVLDCSNVIFISSSGLRVVLNCAKELRTAGKQFQLINVNTDVYKVFNLTGFTGIINISRREKESSQ
ncbi:MAG: STAS domain-containing protein [Syntrophomonas sp.]